jgi:hypothetical protein
MKACSVIVEERTKQLNECAAELTKKIKAALKLESTIRALSNESNFREYIRVTRTEGVGDLEATDRVLALFDAAGVSGSVKTASTTAQGKKQRSGKGKKDEDELDAKTKDRVWELREMSHELRRLTKELVGRVRSLRYFTVVRDLQRQRDEPPSIDCTSCERKSIPMSEVAVLSTCGHTGCMDCVKAAAMREECVCGTAVCSSAARVFNIVPGESLGVDETREVRGKPFGKKLEDMIELLK